MADQWFGQNWVVGQKDGRPLYMNVITGEMTSTPPPTNLSAVAARMSAVNQVNDPEPMDCENENSGHTNSSSSSSCGYAPNRKKKRLTCDIDSPPVPRARYHDPISPPPMTIGAGRSISPTSPPFFNVKVAARCALSCYITLPFFSSALPLEHDTCCLLLSLHKTNPHALFGH